MILAWLCRFNIMALRCEHIVHRLELRKFFKLWAAVAVFTF